MRLRTLLAALLIAAAGTEARAEPIRQDGPKAEQIRQVLQRIRLPPGFRIELYALVPGARAMAVGPAGHVVFVGTTQRDVFAMTLGPRTAERVTSFAPDARFAMPNGVCFAPDGTLYVVEQNRVLAFADAESGSDRADIAGREVVPPGALIPVGEQSHNHSARVCRIGPDDKLYIALGQPYNVPPKAKMALYRQWGMGGIVRMGRDGTGRAVFASGVRNSVGLDFDPATKQLWFTDNQVDGMGDDQPPGEINHATAAGLDFGFPWYGGGHTRTREYADETPPAGLVFPAAEEVAHAADLGLHFYTGSMFPARYHGAIFSAQHGSWNRTVPVGARVMVTEIHPDGSAAASQPFAEGWLDPASGSYGGRPVDVAELADGSLLVSDDHDGAIYRISYDAPK